MIRGLVATVLWTCLAGGVGVGLFFIKHEVKELEGRLAGLNQEIHREQEAIHVLRAEWSYLNDPARLRQLSERHLSMKPLGPNQVASLETLRMAPGGAALANAQPLPKALQPAPAQTTARMTPAAPAAVAAARPAQPRPMVAKAETRPAPVPAQAPAQVPAKSRAIIINSPALAASDLGPGAR